MRLLQCRLCFLIAVIALFLQLNPAWGATPLELDATISSGVDSKFYFATGANAGKPGGIVGVVLDGKLVFQRAYGMADVAGALPNSIAAPFYLASVSKQFTAMCVLLCQEKGLLTLNDELRLHIPELDPVFNGVKIQHLLNMISAIQDVGTGDQSKNAHEMLSRLMEEGSYGLVPAEMPIGSTMKYTNMNYVLLSIIVERVTGKAFSQFAQEEIFAKLGMNETFIHDSGAMVVANQPNGYDTSLALWTTAATTSPATGSTGVISTLTDLMKWHQNFYANQLGNKDQNLITLMETPGRYTSGAKIGQPVADSANGLPSYACGLMPDSLWNANGFIKRVWHTGRWLGFKTGSYRYPDLNMSVFVLLNRDDQFPPAQAVADIFTANLRFATAPPPATLDRGVPYSFKYSATGWPRPTYTLESGSLPGGLTLRADGTLVGTPTTVGDFSGAVKATSAAKTLSQNFSIHVAEPSAYTLAVTMAGAGDGTVNSSPSGISCASGASAGCSTTFLSGSDVSLLATPSSSSLFSGWSNGCSGSGACSINLTDHTAVTATFGLNIQLKLANALTTHATLQQAYSAANSGETFLLHVYTFNEQVNFNRPINIRLKGGMDAGYASTLGVTTIQGSLTVGQGSVEISDLVVR